MKSNLTNQIVKVADELKKLLEMYDETLKGEDLNKLPKPLQRSISANKIKVQMVFDNNFKEHFVDKDYALKSTAEAVDNILNN